MSLPRVVVTSCFVGVGVTGVDSYNDNAED